MPGTGWPPWGVQQGTGQAHWGDTGSEDRAGLPSLPARPRTVTYIPPPGDSGWLCKGLGGTRGPSSKPKSAPRPFWSRHLPVPGLVPAGCGCWCQLGRGANDGNPSLLAPLPAFFPPIERLRITCDHWPVSRPHALSGLSTHIRILWSSFQALLLSLLPPSPWVPVAIQPPLCCPARWIHSYSYPRACLSR